MNFPLADPVPHLRLAIGDGWVPGNTRDDEVFVLHVGEWKLTPSAERPFQSCSSRSQKSLTLVQPALASAFPSLLPLSPRGLLSVLVMRGFLNTVCLSSSEVLVGSDLHRPGLTLNQAPSTFFHREQGGLLSLGAENS